MLDKNKEKEKVKGMKHLIIIILLVLIAIVVVCTHVKVNKMYRSHKKMMNKHGKFMSDMGKEKGFFEKEFKKGDREARMSGKEVRDDFRGEKTKRVDREGFYTKAEYNEKAKEFNVEVKLPKGFTREDMKVNLDNNILEIDLEKKQTRNEDDFEGVRYFSYSRSFVLPETKAKVRDIKEKQNGDKINLMVPIK